MDVNDSSIAFRSIIWTDIDWWVEDGDELGEAMGNTLNRCMLQVLLKGVPSDKGVCKSRCTLGMWKNTGAEFSLIDDCEVANRYCLETRINCRTAWWTCARVWMLYAADRYRTEKCGTDFHILFCYCCGFGATSSRFQSANCRPPLASFRSSV